MKLISLNVWMGILRGPLLDFVRARRSETDLFCFQEMLNGGSDEGEKIWSDATEVREHNLLAILKETLATHGPFFRPYLSTWAGLAMFIRDGIEILEEGEEFVFRPPIDAAGGPSPRNLQYAKIRIGKRQITIVNFHGLWSGGGKEDSEDRINQSRRILEFVNHLEGDFLICGDFNLGPETESLRMLENCGLRNLIKENRISSTRTRYYAKPMKFADYILVSAGINVSTFEVLSDEVSDHLAMYLEFE